MCADQRRACLGGVSKKHGSREHKASDFKCSVWSSREPFVGSPEREAILKKKIRIVLNGEERILEVVPYRLLLDLLRDEIGMTGTKEGCGTGDCGACTILLNGKPVNSCLVFAGELDGADIVTIEGLKIGPELHPVQEAFRQDGGAQCGYCTPGMLMMTAALLKENVRPSEEEIRLALSGNPRQCTRYER